MARGPEITAGALIQSAWALFQRDMFVLVAVPFLANLLVQGMALAFEQITGSVSLFMDLVFGPVILGIVLCLVRDADAGIRRPFAETWAEVSPYTMQLILLSLAAALITAIGLVLLIVPGLYAAAVLLVHVPLLMFGGAGWGALKESYALSKPHAWRLVGLILIIAGLLLAILLVLGGVVAALQAALPAPILWGGIMLVASGAFTGFYGCILYVLYTALGGGSRDVSAVFR